ncbi:MAG: 4Fe-4S binding protein [Bacteroidota bacterium]
MGVGRILPEAVKCFVRKPATVLYPSERLPVPDGLRGAPIVDSEACIGCRICARQCPAASIEMVDVGVKAPRPAFQYDICIFCAVCAEVCPKKAITMTGEYEIAATDRKALVRMPAKPQPPAIGADKGAVVQGD